MRSAELPADLATIAREATRNGQLRTEPRTARVIGLGHHVPPEVVPNSDIAERIGVDDAWIRSAPVSRAAARCARDAVRLRHLRGPPGAARTPASTRATSTSCSWRR